MLDDSAFVESDQPWVPVPYNVVRWRIMGANATGDSAEVRPVAVLLLTLRVTETSDEFDMEIPIDPVTAEGVAKGLLSFVETCKKVT